MEMRHKKILHVLLLVRGIRSVFMKMIVFGSSLKVFKHEISVGGIMNNWGEIIEKGEAT